MIYIDRLIARLRVKVTAILPSVGTTSGVHSLRIELMRKVSGGGAVATVGLPNEKIINEYNQSQTKSVTTGSCGKLGTIFGLYWTA